MSKNEIAGSVLISGATSGIGFETLKLFHSRGYYVYFTFKNNRKSAKNIEKNYKNTKSFRLDLSKNINIKNFYQNFKKLNIKLDALINNAAETSFIKSNDKYTLNENYFLHLVQINLVSVYSMIYGSINFLKQGSSIINLSSVAAFNGIGSNIAYSASKAGVLNLTKSLSKQFKGKFRVNAVAPGLLKTNLTKNFPKRYFDKYKDLTPSGKLLDPKDIADVVVSLVCDMKSVNGECIIVDGGCV